MRSLFLAWRSPKRAWFPIGRLDANPAEPNFVFRYTQGALKAKADQGFAPLAAFPDFSTVYKSDELFPLFQNRVLHSNRRDFADYLRTLDLDPESGDPIEILSVTGGTRETDSLEVFPRIVKSPDGSFKSRFFVHGLRYMSEAAQAAAMSLLPGAQLGVSLELTNPATRVAIQLTSDGYQFVGWTPRYLVSDLLQAIGEHPAVKASVVRVNSTDVPQNRRILVELSGYLPATIEPMSSEEFLPVTGSGILAPASATH